MTDNTQELDEIMDKIYDLAYDHLPERGIAIGTDRIKQSILDWHNKRELEARIGTLEYAKIAPKFKIEEKIEQLRLELKKYEQSS